METTPFQATLIPGISVLLPLACRAEPVPAALAMEAGSLVALATQQDLRVTDLQATEAAAHRAMALQAQKADTVPLLVTDPLRAVQEDTEQKQEGRRIVTQAD